MQLRIFEYFIACTVLSTAVVFSYNLGIGFDYLFASACLVVPFYVFGNYLKNKYAYIFISIVIWLAYLLRPLLLIPNKDLFKYLKLSTIDNPLISSSIIKIGIYNACLLLGFCLSSAWFGMNSMQKYTMLAAGSPGDVFLLKRKKYVKVFTLIAVALLAAFNLLLKVGVKKVAASSSGILIFLIPELLVHLVCILYIFKYKIYVKTYSAILGVFVILGLLGGSKGAFAEIALLIIFYFLQKSGNFKAEVTKVVPFVLGATVFLFATFSIANQIKYGILFSGRSFGFDVVSIFGKGFVEAFRPSNMLYFFDLVTTRFNGFDGFLVTEIYQSDLLKEVFSFANTTRRIIAKLVPFDGGIPTISTGKAVGIEYVGFSADKSFSGAVGLWGAIQLMAGAYGELLAFVMGSVWAYLLCQFQKVSDPDISFVLQGFVMLLMAESILSGNFDNTVSWFIIRICQLFFYVSMINFISPKRVGG